MMHGHRNLSCLVWLVQAVIICEFSGDSNSEVTVILRDQIVSVVDVT